MPDRFPLPFAPATAVALGRHRSGGSARSASRSMKSDGRPATIALGRHRSSPAARRRSGGGSVKSVTSDLTEPALESPRSAAADVSVSDKARVFANDTDADDDGTHATDETQATDGSQSQMTEGAVVPDSMENVGEPQIVAADSEATSESGRKNSKKKFWLKPKIGPKPPKPLTIEDADLLEKGAEEVEVVANIASGDGATCASKKSASDNESQKVAASIENKEELPIIDSNMSLSEVSTATSASGRTKKKRSWLKPSLGLKKNLAEDITQPEKELESDSHAEDKSVSTLSANEDAEQQIKTAGLPNEVASESGEGESEQEKREEEKPKLKLAPKNDARSLVDEAAKEDIKSFDMEAAQIKEVDVPIKDSNVSDSNKPLEEKAGEKNSVKDSTSADTASECSGNKKEKLRLSLSSFSKAMSKSNISMPKPGAKHQAGKEDTDRSKSKEGAVESVVADGGEEGYTAQVAAVASVAPTVKVSNVSLNSTTGAKSEEDLLKICTSYSTLSIMTNDTTLDHVSGEKSNSSLVWRHILLDEMRQVKESLDVINVAKSTNIEKLDDIKQNCFSGLEALPPDAPEDMKEGYYRALSRAAVLNARMESRRAELELRMIELESMRVDVQIGCMMDRNGLDEGEEFDDDTATDLDTLDDTLATEASTESFLGFLQRMFMPRSERRSAAAAPTRPVAATTVLKW